MVAVEHGNANPRRVILVKYTQPFSSNKIVIPSKQCSAVEMFIIKGTTGDTYTGCSVGGFEVTSTGYLVALNSINQGSTSDIRNIYLSYIDKNGTTAVDEKITSYTSMSPTTPVLFRIDANNFIVLWSYNGRVQYCKVDNYGKLKSEIMSFDAELSDCQPVMYGGNMLWYVWNNSKVSFYSINTTDLTKKNVNIAQVGHDYESVSASGTSVNLRCKECGNTTSGKVPSEFKLLWEMSDYTDMWFSPETASSYHLGNVIKLQVSYVEADYNDYEIISSDENVAKIIYEDGYYKVVVGNEGTATVTIRSVYNKSIKS